MDMDSAIRGIREKIEALEAELDAIIEERRKEFNYTITRQRARFEKSVRRQHRLLKMGVLPYIARARPVTILTAPFIYAMIVPMATLDLFLFVFQHTCFRAYGVPRVKRADFIVIDRHHLAYLNVLERLNCAYCGYASGLAAYFHEIAARTEQYWCPIKHAVRVRQPHRRYAGYIDYGDPEEYRARLKEMQERTRRSR